MSQTGMPPDLRHTPDLTIALTPDVVVGVCHQLLMSKVGHHEVKLSIKTQNLQVL